MVRRACSYGLILVAAFFSFGFRACWENDAGAGDRCSDFTSCGMCTLDSTCGWCGASSTCHTGTAAGSTVGLACGGGWAWLSSECASPPVDAGPTVRMDAGSPGIDSGPLPGTDSGGLPGIDSGATGTDAGRPPCGGACTPGTHCDTPSDMCVPDVGSCAFVTCPSTYSWTWFSGGGGTRPTCCLDLDVSPLGATCGRETAPGSCSFAGGESPTDQDVTFAPSNQMHCALPSGTIDCPALYISGTASRAYNDGCCGVMGGVSFCGVTANCGGPCCAPPLASDTPVP